MRFLYETAALFQKHSDTIRVPFPANRNAIAPYFAYCPLLFISLRRNNSHSRPCRLFHCSVTIRVGRSAKHDTLAKQNAAEGTRAMPTWRGDGLLRAPDIPTFSYDVSDSVQKTCAPSPSIGKSIGKSRCFRALIATKKTAGFLRIEFLRIYKTTSRLLK